MSGSSNPSLENPAPVGNFNESINAPPTKPGEGNNPQQRCMYYYTYLTPSPPFMSITLTFHCIAYLVAKGAYSDAGESTDLGNDFWPEDHVTEK
jgi:hypothetical protein